MKMQPNLLVTLACVGITHYFGAEVAQAQLGWSRAQAEKWLVLEDEEEDELFLSGDGNPTQYLAHPKGKLGPKFIISFLEDKVVAIRPVDCRDMEFKDVIAGLDTFNFRIEGNERKQIQWKATNSFLTAFPPVGESSREVLPLTKTIGQQRTVAFNAQTGQVLGASPWSDLSVPTGRFLSYEKGSSCSADTLVSKDGHLYARLVSNSYRSGPSTTTHISQFVICDATYFWKLSGQTIGRDYDSSLYEFSFKKFVPQELQPQVRRRRYLAMFMGLANTSALSPKELANLAKDIEEPRDDLLSALSHKLDKQPPPVKKQRMSVLAELFGPKAIKTLMAMRRQPGDVGEKATEVLRQIANEHDLPDPPADEGTLAEWSRWAQQVDQAEAE